MECYVRDVFLNAPPLILRTASNTIPMFIDTQWHQCLEQDAFKCHYAWLVILFGFHNTPIYWNQSSWIRLTKSIQWFDEHPTMSRCLRISVQLWKTSCKQLDFFMSLGIVACHSGQRKTVLFVKGQCVYKQCSQSHLILLYGASQPGINTDCITLLAAGSTGDS